jgi:hypothetical protein
MKKASFGLGLAGGILGVVMSIYNTIALLVLKNIDIPDISEKLHIPDMFEHSGFFFSNFRLGTLVSTYYWAGVVLILAAGILGIIGASILKKKNTAAGVLMLVGAGLCIISGMHTLVAALLIAAGILALVKPKEKKPEESQV